MNLFIILIYLFLILNKYIKTEKELSYLLVKRN